jgi:hypothetical protein
MNKQDIRDKQRARHQRGRLKRYLIIAIAIFGLAAITWGIVAPNFRAEIGEAVPELPAEHVNEGEDPGPYNTNPPTSGTHYAADLDAGFYDMGDIANLGPFPEGYLVHNLEHGYVIFWYNCEILDESACSQLKTDIQDVIKRERNIKVIGFPWPSIDVPVVMTSWARSLSFDTFDPGLARQFVRTYRNQAPEPNAP